jgi:murein DD-endopeptidase MepM/ murein hydrolase activator NlpD
MTRAARGQSLVSSAPPPATRREQRRLERRFGIPSVVRPRPATAAGRGRLHGIGARILTLAAMAFVALLTVGMSIPASAFGTAAGQSGVIAAEKQQRAAQTLAVDAAAQESSTGRDSYAVTTRAQFAAAAAAAVRAQQAAAAQAAALAAKRAGFNPTGTGPVRWPFPASVPLGPGYGAPSTCRGCQAVHQGQDFLAGDGASIYAIADGVVTAHEESGSLGNHLTVTHTIDGQTVTSMYAHMQSGSSPLRVGDHVAVGQFVGSVGSTGAATAPHLHLEIEVNGVHVDPYVWLQQHAG